MKIRKKKVEGPKSFINVMVGTAGHVDHGKTQLVKLLTGCETDRLKEEKRRGLSINLGFAPCVIGGETNVGIVDVPGHESFIRNMVAGVTGIDVVLLVVAADDGIMPQTREHFNIIDLLGVRNGLCAVTKTDLVDAETVELVVEELRDFFRGTFMEDGSIVPISSQTGAGFDAFYTSLIDTVKTTSLRDTSGLFRLAVERSFSVPGFGTVVSGIPASGKVSVGDQLELLPHGLKGRVRGLQVFQHDEEIGFAGQCVAVNISDIPLEKAERGTVLSAPGHFEPARYLSARFKVLRDCKEPVKHNAPIRLHTGTTETFGKVALLEGKLLHPGETGLVEFILETPVVAVPGDRFVVRRRSPAVTIGGGVMVGIEQRRLRRGREGVIARVGAEEQALASPVAAVVLELRQSEAILSAQKLAPLVHLPLETVEKGLSEAVADGSVIEVGRGYVLAAVVDHSMDTVRASLHELLGELTRGKKVLKTALKERTKLDGKLFALAWTRLVASGEVTEELGAARFVCREDSLSGTQRKLVDPVAEAFRAAAFKTPRVEQVAETLKASSDDLVRVVDFLKDRGTLVEAGKHAIFHAENVDRARAILTKQLNEEGFLESGLFKNLIGTSRKYAIPLLDYFDAIGVTRRGPDNRRYLAEKKD